MPPEQCSLCEGTPEKGCVNGNVMVEEGKAQECPNITRKRFQQYLKARLTPDLYQAPKIMESPLYVPPKIKGEKAAINRTGENLFIRGIDLAGFLPHLRLVFVCLPGLKYKVVDDSRLRDVFVGGESYANRPKTSREQRETNNVVSDLVGQEYDLVVIRLGVLAYKNQAAPAVLREALMVREGLGKPTWLFEDSDPTINWICSRDMDLETYVGKRFTDVYLANDGPKAEKVESGIVVEEYDAAPPQEFQELSRRNEEEPDVGLGNLLGGGKPKKKWGR